MQKRLWLAALTVPVVLGVPGGLAADRAECAQQATYLETLLYDARQSLEIFERQPMYLTDAVSPEAKASTAASIAAWTDASRAMTAYVQSLEDATYLLRVCARS